jgi:hypothetical protein
VNKRLNVLLEVAIAISMADKMEEVQNALSWGSDLNSSQFNELDEPGKGVE